MSYDAFNARRQPASMARRQASGSSSGVALDRGLANGREIIVWVELFYLV
jgi:hypothetical protein